MNHYNGFELPQGVDITRNGVTMSADEIVDTLERLERELEESRKDEVQDRERASKIDELSRHHPIIRQALTMGWHFKRPRLECMEVAVLALAESNQHLQKVATDAVIHGRSAFIVDPSGIQAVDAERLNNDLTVRALEDRIATLHDLVRRIHDELHYGEIYRWNNGSPVWADMNAEVTGERVQEKPKQPPMTERELRKLCKDLGIEHYLKPPREPGSTTKLYPNLSRAAQKRLDDMGATAQGVLVTNQAGAWAAVSDTGRVMWLDEDDWEDSES